MSTFNDGQTATVATATTFTEPSLNFPVAPPPPGCSLAVYPPAVHFENVQHGYAYVMTISVRNVGVESRRIRLSIPHAKSFFKLRYEPQGALAMGIEARAEVEFRLQEDATDDMARQFLSDKLVVSCGDEKVEVPLLATLPAPVLEFEPFVNLGPIVFDQSAVREVTFRNSGTKAGAFTITLDEGAPVKLRPKHALLEPGHHTIVQIDVQGKELGPLRALATVQMDEQPPRILDISATVVEQRLELALEAGGGALGGIDFGSVFYGQKRTVRAMLLTHGPQPVPYSSSTSILEGTHERMPTPPGHHAEPGEDENEEECRAITISPGEGLIEAMGHALLSFTFKPTLREFHRGFAASLSNPTRRLAYKVVVDAPDLNQQFTVEVTGRAVVPELIPSPTVLDFGDCPMNERRDMSLELRNPTELPLPFAFPTLPLVHVTPASGVIPAGQTQAVVVSYRPSQMGALRRYLDVSIADGIASVSLTLSGRCRTLGSKPAMVGGVDRVPEDFAPRLEYVRPEEVARQKSNRKNAGKGGGWHRMKPYDEVDVLVSTSWDESDPRPSPMAQYTFSIQDLARRDDHRDKYNNFIKESRLKRESRAQKEEIQRRKSTLRRDPDEDEGVDLGLGRAMREPSMRLPPPAEQLWLETAPDGSHAAQQAGGRKKLQLDENRLITKKFKPAPTTQAEVRDCSKSLTPQDLLNIVASHKVLDFGRVSVDSTVVKSFAVANLLPQCVVVALPKLDPEIRGSGPSSQVVPEGLTAGFDMHFSCPAVGLIKRTVAFTVNDKHTFKFTVTADVVPLELTLSHKELTMQFAEDSVESTVSETITIENPGTANADFFWAARGAFTVKPEQGNIPARSKMEAVVTWRPTPGLRNEDLLTLSVPNGKDAELRVNGLCSEPKVSLLDKKVEFGTLAVGLRQERTIRFKNLSSVPAVISLDPAIKEMGVTVHPEVARLSINNETVELKVCLNPPAPRDYQGLALVFNIRGGRNLRLPISAEAIIPDIYLDQPPGGFDFGTVALGSDFTLPMTIANRGAIPACLTLDLSTADGFSIATALEDIKVTGLKGGDTAEAVDKSMIIRPVLGSRNGDNDDDSVSSQVEEARCWQLLVPAMVTLQLPFTFQPEGIGLVGLNLPLSLQGVASGPALAVPVRAEGVAPRMVLSMSHVDFGDRVVSRDAGSNNTYHQEVQITNATRHPVPWELDDTPIKEAKMMDPHAPNTFFVSPRFGELRAGEIVKLRVTFCPKGRYDYKINLPIYLTDTPDRSRPYATLRIRGSGVRPSLSFNHEAIIMPVVPLNVRSRAQFWVVNNGFSSLELTHKLPSFVPVQVNLTYPEGRQVGTGIPKVPVIIDFKATKPLSLNIRLEFSDPEGRKFSLPLVACADNCLLTIGRFLTQYADRYMLYRRDDGPVSLYHASVVKALRGQEAKSRDKEKKRRAEERMAAVKALSSEQQPEAEDASKASKPSKTPPRKKGGSEASDEISRMIQSQDEMQTDLGKEDPPFAERSLDTMVQWLNFHVMGSTKIKRLPSDLIESQGKLLIEAVEAMANYKLPNKVKMLSSARKERIGQLIGQYGDLLLFLKEKGALLNGVCPEYLLTKDDFVFYKESLDERRGKDSRVTPRQAKEQRNYWDKSFNGLSIESWATLLYQSIRVFMLSRVTPKSYKALPGLQDKALTGKQEAALSTSSVYNASELLLLRWLNAHVASTLGSAPTKAGGVCDFEKDLRDGSAFCHALASHLSFLNGPGKPLEGYLTANKVAELQTPEGRLGNAKRVVACLDALQLNYGLTPDSLLKGAATDLLLLTLHLQMVLPQFIPKATVEFRSVIGVRNRKAIELQNPNKVPIKYHVTMEGSKDFHLAQETLEIEPHGSAEFLVECEPRFSEEVEARLTFWPQRQGGRGGSHMIFMLRSVVVGRKAAASLNFTGQTYDVGAFTVDVRNPFAADCNLAISTVQTFVEPMLFRGNGVNGAAALRSLQQQLSGNNSSNHNNASKNGDDGRSLRTNGSSKAASNASSASERVAIKRGPPTPDRLMPAAEEEAEAISMLKCPFFPATESMRLKAKESTPLTLHMVAFYPGTYACQLVFSDKEQGEFAIDVMVVVDLPKALNRLTCDLSYEEGVLHRELRLPSSNPALQKAITTTCDRLPLNMRQRMRQALVSLLRPPTSANSLATYRLEMDSPYWVCPSTVELYFDSPQAPPPSGNGNSSNNPNNSSNNAASGQPAAASAGAPASKNSGVARSGGKDTVAALLPPTASDAPPDPANRTLVAVNAADAGSYPTRLFLYPLHAPLPDFRVFELEAEVTAAKVSTSFTFRAPARQTITQDIPVTNSSDQPWVLNVTIEGSKAFTGPPSITVPPRARGDKAARYKLSYTPSWIGEDKGRVVFKFVNTDESFEYSLTGVGEEPLAQANVNIRAKAREDTVERLSISNWLNAETTFTVESDLPYVGGPPEITLPAHGTGDYEFCIHAAMGGVYNGSITFTAPNGQYLWYTIQMNVGSPVAENTIEAKAKVRQALAIELVIENPFPEELELDVVIDGEYLMGDTSMVIEGGGSKAYQLLYSPLVPKIHNGSVAFLNPKVGEFWYKVKMEAVPADPILLPPVSCAVGDRALIPVTVQNPTGQAVMLMSVVENKRNFSVEPNKVSLPPYGSASFNVVYSPSSLSTPETGTIELVHPDIGTYVYCVEGSGQLPGIMPEHTPTSVVGQLNSYMFSFRNPFNTALSLDIVLRIDESRQGQRNSGDDNASADSTQPSNNGTGPQNNTSERRSSGGVGITPSPLDPVFNLLLKKTTQVPLGAFASMQIPLSFYPPTIASRSATLEIRGAYRGHDLTWVFPIKGIAEAPMQRRAFSIHCAAKRSVRQEIDLELKGLENVNKAGEEFEHELVLPANGASLLSQWLHITPLKTELGDKDEKLRYLVSFEPCKPISATVEFVVLRKSGGRWRYEMRVEATEPEPDDVIQIEAAIHTTTILNFRLCNRHLTFAPFQAYFSTDSAYDITVTPNNGVLPPFGAEGTMFSLTFSPHEYGKHERARLFIETDDDVWSYEVKGTYPGFEAPTHVQPKVDCHISKHIGERLTMVNSTNIVRKNLTTKSLRSPSERRKKRFWRKTSSESDFMGGTGRTQNVNTVAFSLTVPPLDGPEKPPYA